MKSIFVQAAFDIDCEWEGISPVYRVYVNDELFAERTWRWTDCYLKENLKIEGPPGQYHVRFEPVGPQIAEFKTSNYSIKLGPGRWIENGILEILDESQ